LWQIKFSFNYFNIDKGTPKTDGGADTMYIVDRSISQGKRAGVYSVFGIITGSLVYTLFVSFGLRLLM